MSNNQTVRDRQAEELRQALADLGHELDKAFGITRLLNWLSRKLGER